jgi:hypothetical protein
VLDTTLSDQDCQWLAAGWWVYPGTPVSSTNRTDHHDIAEILLKVALNTITLTPNILICIPRLSLHSLIRLKKDQNSFSLVLYLTGAGRYSPYF